MGERRVRVPSRNMNNGHKGIDKEGIDVGSGGGWGRGEQWGKRRDNCN